MKLELRTEGVAMSKGLREFIDRKLNFAFSRFGQRVRHVRVRLTDVNGPRNGEDIRCHIQATLSPVGFVTIQEQRSDPFAAVARATDRVSRNLARHVERLHSRRKGR